MGHNLILEKNLLHDLELKDAYTHVKSYISKYIRSEGDYFLELGCGPARLSCLLAKEGIKTVGIDLSLNGLRLAKALFKRKNVKGYFVCGNILEMPFKDNVFSFSYGGGVLEHFRDTQKAVNEIYRLTVRGGFTTNTVPYLSLSTIYRMCRWGNVPDIPMMGDIIELLGVKVLKGRYLRFGYEKSFTSSKIKKIFRRAGFRNVETGLFKTHYPLEIISSPVIKEAISKLANSSRLFWPMIYINGEK
ncbi:MAG: class I SAM-dependent methyltransferase [Thermoproteota archaeon]